MIIQSDTRQKRKHHGIKEQWFKEHGHELIHSKMLVGDYCIPSDGSVSVDTKANISELYSNLIQDHDRFHNECVLAQDCGIKLYILIENRDGVKSIDDLKHWKNPQMYRYYKAKRKAEAEGKKPPRPPASNIQLVKMIHTMRKEYGVEFVFCEPEEAAQKVVELLTGGGK